MASGRGDIGLANFCRKLLPSKRGGRAGFGLSFLIDSHTIRSTRPPWSQSPITVSANADTAHAVLPIGPPRRPSQYSWRRTVMGLSFVTRTTAAWHLLRSSSDGPRRVALRPHKTQQCCDACQCGEREKARHRSLDKELRRDPKGRLSLA